jgi:phosphatidylglycerol:prolipoprotein diacylglycerol transferase
MHPILFELSGMKIQSYGVLRLLSYAAAIGLLLLTAKKLREPLLTAEQGMIAMVVGLLLGGRLGFMLVNWDEPWTLGQALDLSGGFLAFTALLGGLLALIGFALVKRHPVWTMLDLVTPSVVGAWAVGNIGCFLAGCCWGSRTDLPWGVGFSTDLTPPELRGVPVHPAQLYAMIFEAMLLGSFFLWPRRLPGELFLRGVAAMLLMRVGLQLSDVRPGMLPSSILYAVIALAAAGAFFLKRGKAAPAVPAAGS